MECQESTNSILAEISNEFSKPSNNTPKVDLTRTYTEPLYTIEIGGVKGLPQGDLVAVSAKPKQGKSFLCSIIASAVLSGECCEVKGLVSNPKLCYFDTEMHLRNSAKLARRIHRLCGWSTNENNPKFMCYSLRTFTSAERMTFIENTIQAEKPNFIVVDGVRDLIEDFNDISQSADCINRLMKWSADSNACVVCVLHQCKSKDNNSMRGHLGSELLNKCADMIEIKKTDKVFQVTTADSRNETIPDWAFSINEEGLPFLYDGQSIADDARVSKMKDALHFCLDKGELSYNRLVEQYSVAYGCTPVTSKRHIAEALRNKFLSQNSKGEYYIIN